MTDLAFQIISELMNHTDAVSSEQLAMHCGVSSKSIRRCISALKQNSRHYGFDIHTRPGFGSSLIICDQIIFRQYLMTLQNRQIPDTPDKRKVYILQHLLYQDDYVKLYELAEELYISLSQLNTDLKEIKRLLSVYQLSIISKANLGIRIEGDERDKRQCMAQYCFHDQSASFSMFANQLSNAGTLNHIIEQAVTPVLLQENMHVSDVGAQSLAIHLLIASERIKNDNIITMSPASQAALVQKAEYRVAAQMAMQAGVVFQTTFPQAEICYLTQHILGKQHFEPTENDGGESQNDSEILLLVNKMLRAIFDHTKLDFFYDRDLKKNLMLHMIPFVNRLKSGLSIHNPILDDVKKKYSFAFELAAIGLAAVGANLHVSISEDEISYFALHLILALERRQESSPVHILIICSTGRATSQLLAYQIKKKFAACINTIKIIEYYKLDSIELDTYDYAFSTVPIHKQLPIPVLQISNLLDIQDFELIEQTLYKKKQRFDIRSIVKPNLFYTDVAGTSRDEILCAMVQLIQKDIQLPDDFLRLIQERESYAATDLVNGVAIPHPNKPVSSQSFVSIGVLKHAVLWESKQVQIIFLISVAPAQEETISYFFELLSTFITQDKKIRQFLKKPEYEYMLELLHK